MKTVYNTKGSESMRKNATKGLCRHITPNLSKRFYTAPTHRWVNPIDAHLKAAHAKKMSAQTLIRRHAYAARC